jgi:hypothetical protein
MNFNLKERKENFNRYLNLKDSGGNPAQTIRGTQTRMAAGRLTRSLTNERDQRTTNKISTTV